MMVWCASYNHLTWVDSMLGTSARAPSSMTGSDGMQSISRENMLITIAAGSTREPLV